MEISIRKEGRAAVVSVSGRIDAVSGPEYQKNLEALISQGDLYLVMDFDRLDYISSAGLRAILFTAKLLRTKGGKILFARVQPTVKEIFDIAGFASLFPIHPTVESALKEIA